MIFNVFNTANSLKKNKKTTMCLLYLNAFGLPPVCVSAPCPFVPNGVITFKDKSEKYTSLSKQLGT